MPDAKIIISELCDAHFKALDSPEIDCKICNGYWRTYLDMYFQRAAKNPHPRKKTDLLRWLKTVAETQELTAPSDSRLGECLRNHIPEEWSRACGESKSTDPEEVTRRAHKK